MLFTAGGKGIMITDPEDAIKFSIIVPVYGTERYIRECVDSILIQEFRSFELILVDDGSPDLCSQICDEYMRADSRVRVIHKGNGGVSSARNAGIEIAKGQYIWFVDSDDSIASGSLQILNEKLTEKENALLAFQTDLSGEVRFEGIEEYLVNLHFPYKVNFTVWSKVYQLAFINTHGIRFDEEEGIGEDLLFNLTCYRYLFMEGQEISFDHRCFYHYRKRDGSAMQTERSDAFEVQMRLFRKTCDLLRNNVRKQILEQFFLQYMIAGIRQSRALPANQFAEVVRKNDLYQMNVSQSATEAFLKAEKASMAGRMRIHLFIALMKHKQYVFAGRIMGMR